MRKVFKTSSDNSYSWNRLPKSLFLVDNYRATAVYGKVSLEKSEICRFESVHPNIYAVYELLQLIDNSKLQNQIREHIINIEDSFVNSQEWTISRRVLELRVAVIGGLRSGKSALVHRYLTGSYVNDESPEGGRFKKEVNVEGESHLLLIRDEGEHFVNIHILSLINSVGTVKLLYRKDLRFR